MNLFNKLTRDDNERIGRFGQKIVSDYFIKKGWAVFDVDQCRPQTAPLIHAPNGKSYPMPDLMLHKNNEIDFCEVKTQADRHEAFMLSMEQYTRYEEMRKVLKWEFFNLVFVNHVNGQFKMYAADLSQKHNIFKFKDSGKEYAFYQIKDLKELK